jgi:hypothetical protein
MSVEIQGLCSPPTPRNRHRPTILQCDHVGMDRPRFVDEAS